MVSDRYPIVTDELINYLDRIYSDKLPSEYRGEFAMGKLLGEVSVVRHLKMIRDEQRENMLGSQLSLFGDNS